MAVVIELVEGYQWVVAVAIANVMITDWMAFAVSTVLDMPSQNICAIMDEG